MTIALIAVGGAVVALAVIALLIRGERRARSYADERVGGAVERISSRMDELTATILDALSVGERTEERAARFDGISSTLELDDVMRRTVHAAAHVDRVDAVVVETRLLDGGRANASEGLADTPIEQGFSGPPDGAPYRALSISYLYEPGSPEDLAPDALQSAFAVPLRHEGEEVGLLAAYSTAGQDELAEAAAAELDALAQRAGPAVDHARRFREARQLADLDALTGLGNRRTFHENLAREVSRAHRYGRRLSLLLLDLDDFKLVNDDIGHLAGDAVLSDVAERIRSVVRTADVPCRIGGDEFAVILPEASLTDAEGTFARIHAALAAQPLSHGATTGLSGGVAELREHDEPLVLFERADRALYRAKGAGKGTAGIEDRLREGGWPSERAAQSPEHPVG